MRGWRRSKPRAFIRCRLVLDEEIIRIVPVGEAIGAVRRQTHSPMPLPAALR